jgi:2-dehydropantoate 2-reductase
VRFVIYGAGAVGGVIGARLHQSGREVMLIARGAHHDAIAARGLRFETPTEASTLQIPVAPDPAAARVGTGDVVLLCTKSQDTWPALLALREAAPDGVPVVCAQNGVENERVALRLFTDVTGAVVLLPAEHLEPGVVIGSGAIISGRIDLGRYPSGTSEICEEVSAALNDARFESAVSQDIMRLKHAKLINNLANSVQAVCGSTDHAEALVDRIQEEGRVVLRAAGIAFDAPEVTERDDRWQRYGVAPVAGRPRGGGSTWQSVARGTGHVETDYLNGEIVLRARELGLDVPLNRLMQRLILETIRGGHPPGWLTPAEVLARLERV